MPVSVCSNRYRHRYRYRYKYRYVYSSSLDRNGIKVSALNEFTVQWGESSIARGVLDGRAPGSLGWAGTVTTPFMALVIESTARRGAEEGI